MKEEPLDISYHKNVLSAEEAEEIIAWAKPRLERSGVIPEKDQVDIQDMRTSRHTWLPHNTFESTRRITEYVSKLTGLSPSHFEDFQVIYYNLGQEYDYHYDTCEPKTPECEEGMDENGFGLRRFTFFLYLNDVEEGGETSFVFPNIKVKPERGKGILWRNTLRDGSGGTNMNAMHAGLPPKGGEKWAMNLWIRTKPYVENQNW